MSVTALAIVITVILNASAQIFLRSGVKDIPVDMLLAQRDIAGLVVRIINGGVIAGLMAYVISVVTWMYVLSRLPVSVAYPAVSLAYVVGVGMGWLFLGEQVSAGRLLGVGIVLIGITVIARNA